MLATCVIYVSSCNNYGKVKAKVFFPKRRNFLLLTQNFPDYVPPVATVVEA